jgi:protein phosphatase 1 regulatory subunit 42
LYDNQIEAIQNLNFAGILQYLYLQNNLIKEIPHLSMPYLRKLYLDENEIKVVTGLTECVNIEELHLARQRLPSYTSIEFIPDSLNAMSRTLHVLEISGNNVSKLKQFSVLFNLRKFFCRDNAVLEFPEIESIVSLPNLEEANFSGNPCCTAIFKYRDLTIGAANDNFSVLDDVPIPQHQRIAIKGLMSHRHKIGALSRFQPSQSQVSYEPRELENEESQIENEMN